MVFGKNPLLTKPLKRGGKTDVRRGVLEHDQVIGRRIRDLVQAHKGVSLLSLSHFLFFFFFFFWRTRSHLHVDKVRNTDSVCRLSMNTFL